MKTKQALKLFAVSLILTFIVQHIFLFLFPSSAVNILGYHVHHIFIGAFLLVILSVLFLSGGINKITIIISGISASLVLDELIFSITTDGTRQAYFSGVSLTSSIVMHLIILAFIALIYLNSKRK